MSTVPEPPSEQPQPRALTYLLSPKAMFRLGLGLIVLAVAWFLKYSFDQGWIGDVAKVSMAAATGLGMIVAGIQIAPRRAAYGNSLQGVGAAILYLTAFATHQRYDLTDTTGAFLMLIAISGGVVGMAIRQRSEILATAGVAGALAAPVIIGGSMSVFPGDSGYYVAVLAVAGGLYLANRWWWLFSLATAGAATLVGFESIALWIGAEGDPAEIQIAIAGCWLIGWGVAVIAALRSPEDAISGRLVPIVMTVLVPIGALVATIAAWRLEPGTPAWTSIAFGLALAHLVAFAGLRERQAELASVQLVPAALALAFGWFGAFEGAWIVLALAVQAGALIVVGARIRITVLAMMGHALAAVTGLGWVVLLSMAADSSWHTDDVVTGVILLVAVGVGWSTRDTTPTESALSPVYAGLALPGVLIWSLAVLGPLPDGSGLVTGAWAATGFGILAWGRVQHHSLVRNVGIGVVLLAVAKLLVIDTAAASTPARIVLSASIGLALLAAGYWMAPDEETPDSAVSEDPAAAPSDLTLR